MRKGWHRWVLWLVGLSILIVPFLCGVGCNLVFTLVFAISTYSSDAALHGTMQVYPNAIKLGNDEQLACCDSIQQIYFYWTPDSIDDTRRYYLAFALPFIQDRTIFHPYGGDLKLGLVPYILTDEDRNFLKDRRCHHSQKSSCIQVELVSFAPDKQVILPDLTPTMAEPNNEGSKTALDGGTLIIYSYYVEADFRVEF